MSLKQSYYSLLGKQNYQRDVEEEKFKRDNTEGIVRDIPSMRNIRNTVAGFEIQWGLDL